MKPAKLQFVADCQGIRIARQHMEWLKACIASIYGAEKLQDSYWITRTDILHQYLSENHVSQSLKKYEIEGERFHEPSFDLYLPGELVPIGRLVNVAVPEVS